MRKKPPPKMSKNPTNGFTTPAVNRGIYNQRSIVVDETTSKNGNIKRKKAPFEEKCENSLSYAVFTLSPLLEFIKTILPYKDNAQLRKLLASERTWTMPISIKKLEARKMFENVLESLLPCVSYVWVFIAKAYLILPHRYLFSTYIPIHPY